MAYKNRQVKCLTCNKEFNAIGTFRRRYCSTPCARRGNGRAEYRQDKEAAAKLPQLYSSKTFKCKNCGGLNRQETCWVCEMEKREELRKCITKINKDRQNVNTINR